MIGIHRKRCKKINLHIKMSQKIKNISNIWKITETISKIQVKNWDSTYQISEKHDTFSGWGHGETGLSHHGVGNANWDNLLEENFATAHKITLTFWPTNPTVDPQQYKTTHAWGYSLQHYI